MTGDTAGLITPLCGNGMRITMHSAKIVFENIHLFLENKINRNQLQLNYVKQWNEIFALRLFAGRLVQKLTGNKFTTSAFLSLLNRCPRLAKK